MKTRFALKCLAAVLGVVVLAAVAAVWLTDPVERWRKYYALRDWSVRNWKERPRAQRAVRSLERRLRRLGILGPVIHTVEPGVTLSLDPEDFISRLILFDNYWESGVAGEIRARLPRGAVFLDVGAHVGYHSLLASVRVGPAGKVIAFEPNPKTLVSLRRNLELSRATNVVVEPIACSDSEGMLTLFAGPPSNTAAASLARRNAELQGPSLASYRVRARRIDDVVAELGLQRVDVAKVDVEGAELQVVRGARATLARFHPFVVMEQIPEELAVFGATPADLDTLMKELGYRRRWNISEVDIGYSVQ